MEDQPVERLAQRFGAGEGAKKRHLLLGEQRQRGQAGGGADVAKQGKHLVGNQLAGVLGAAVGLVAVVHGADLHHALAHAALGVELVKKEFGALVELHAQLRRRAGEGRRLPQHDAPLALRTRQAEPAQRHGPHAHRKLPAPQYCLVHGEISALVRRKKGHPPLHCR